MKNHKWKDISFSKHNKAEECTKCGVFRNWRYGDMQCWEYWWPSKSNFSMAKTQLHRPDCEYDIDIKDSGS